MSYEVFIDIDIEEDLYDLLATEQISARTFDALLLLHQTRVDLNRADRQRLYLLPNLDYSHVDGILLHRQRAGELSGLDELVVAGVLSAALAKSLRPFTVARPIDEPREGASGFVRLQTRWTGRHDRLPPAAALQARVRAAGGLDAGLAATLTRNQLGKPRWDRDRRALAVAPERARLVMPKLYVAWKAERWELVAGTYRIGFGQRLTFDVTDQITPNGAFGDFELRRATSLVLRCRRAAGELSASPCPSGATYRVTPDWAWTNRLAGVAVGATRISSAEGWLQVYVWGSYQPHGVAQSHIVDASRCIDPQQDDDERCASPAVVVLDGEPIAPSGAASRATLRAVIAEGLGGAHSSYFWNPRSHIGVTGYAAVPRWLLRGATLDFQESARRPFGGAFGAVGVDAAVGLGPHDLFVELARSFDQQSASRGGYAAVVRSVSTLEAAEVDVSLRYLGSGYANPYARPISAADELDGLRARDEAGFRVRATASIGPRAQLRGLVDVWRSLSSSALRAQLFGRVDWAISRSLTVALWLDHRVGATPRTLAASSLAFSPSAKVRLAGQVQHRWVRAARSRGSHDVTAILNLTARPASRLRIRARARYDVQDIANNHRLPHTVWAHLECGVTVRERDVFQARYDVRAFLDERQSTLERQPNPEHWLWLEYVLRY